MADSDLTAERLVTTAGAMGQEEFTRAELATALGVSVQDLKDAVKEARQSGRLEKVREDDDGKGVFRLTGR